MAYTKHEITHTKTHTSNQWKKRKTKISYNKATYQVFKDKNHKKKEKWKGKESNDHTFLYDLR